MLRWTRRSRIGWAWSDGSDAPLGEEVERYRVTVAPDVGLARTIETSVASWTYSAAMIAADRAAGATHVEAAVVQLGTWAPSDAVRITINLEE